MQVNNKIAYFVNQYPKVSHSFIRREVLALEKKGFEVVRIALRGWDAEVVDAADVAEQQVTKYVLQDGLFSLLMPALSVLLTAPVKFLKALRYAMKMGIRADRSWPYHLIYLVEASRVLQWLKDENVKHIHAHFGTNSTEVVMLAHLLGGPTYSFTVHGPEEFDKTSFIYLKEKIHQAAFVVGISSYTRSQLYRWADYNDWSKIHVVHCGLESSFDNEQVELISELPKLVCVGRLCEQKGQLLLVSALNILAQKGILFELVLAGDGEMREEIERLISQYDLKKYIQITGWISGQQVREHILAAKALVLPSFAEGLPVVIMEAMALRRPVLTTYVAGIPELVINGETGWLTPAGDVNELARTLEELLLTPTNRLDEMGKAGLARVLSRHSVEKEAEKLSALFQDVINLNAEGKLLFPDRKAV